MNIEELFRGVGLVIDDQILIEGSKDKIHKIVADIESKGIPLAKYNHVPNLSVEHCKDFSFVLLDWELVTIYDEQGFPIHGTEELAKIAQEKLLEFIIQLTKTCYVPIFIFSNNSEESINQVLVEHDILDENVNSPIFVKRKSSLVTDKELLFWSIIESWIRQSPAIYVCKKMQNTIKNAEVNMQREFAVFKYWPSVLWKTYTDDSIDPNHELMELLWQNTHVRLSGIEFDSDIVMYKDGDPSKAELQRVLSAQRYTDMVDRKFSQTGDLYKLSNRDFGLNIRPACDCVCRNGADGNVYMLHGSILKDDKLKERYNSSLGNFNEQANDVIIGPIDNGKYLIFRFKKLDVVAYEKIKEKKIGRILPPFITHITEKYGLYVQRQGLPRLPQEAVFADEQPMVSQIDNSTENNNVEAKFASAFNRFKSFFSQCIDN